MLSELHALQSVLDSMPAPRTVLDVGCGSVAYVNFRNAEVTGIDVCQANVDRNQKLAHKIVADVEKLPLPKETFDAVLCWDVLEHLSSPMGTLERLCGCLTPGGIMVIAFPNVLSLKGLVTKFTPHGFHVWVYKHFYSSQNCPYAEPFPTYLRFSMSPVSIKRFAAAHGMAIEYLKLYESPEVRNMRARRKFINASLAVLRHASLLLMRHDTDLTDCIMVLRKGQDRSAVTSSSSKDYRDLTRQQADSDLLVG